MNNYRIPLLSWPGADRIWHTDKKPTEEKPGKLEYDIRNFVNPRPKGKVRFSAIDNQRSELL